MREMKIALAVLKQGDKFLLQQRGNVPKNGGGNLIGYFGGKIESGTALETVCRELAEEISFQPKPDDAEYLGEVDVTSDHNQEKVVINAQVFFFEIKKDQKVEAKEGDLVALTKPEAEAKFDQMTTVTAAAFRQLLGDK